MTKTIPKLLTYKKYEYEDNYYWISVLCSNCGHNSQLAVKKGIRFNAGVLKILKCFRCDVKGTLSKAFWNGKYYVKI